MQSESQRSRRCSGNPRRHGGVGLPHVPSNNPSSAHGLPYVPSLDDLGMPRGNTRRHYAAFRCVNSWKSIDRAIEVPFGHAGAIRKHGVRRSARTARRFLFKGYVISISIPPRERLGAERSYDAGELISELLEDRKFARLAWSSVFAAWSFGLQGSGRENRVAVVLRSLKATAVCPSGPLRFR